MTNTTPDLRLIRFINVCRAEPQPALRLRGNNILDAYASSASSFACRDRACATLLHILRLHNYFWGKTQCQS
jgi:hypothetical protein